MSVSSRKILPHRVPGWVPDGEKFFVTVCCQQRGVNQLCLDDVAKIIFTSVDLYEQQQKWLCHLLLLMPDHLHGIFSFGREPGMKRTLASWKRFLAKEIGIKWQRDFFDHRLRNADEHEAKAKYILLNPVRKELCKRPEDWRWVHRGR